MVRGGDSDFDTRDGLCEGGMEVSSVRVTDRLLEELPSPPRHVGNREGVVETGEPRLFFRQYRFSDESLQYLHLVAVPLQGEYLFGGDISRQLGRLFIRRSADKSFLDIRGA